VLFKLQKVMLDEMQLRGVAGIPKVFIRKEMQQRWVDGFVSSEEWVLDTEGTNLEQVICFEVRFFLTTQNNNNNNNRCD